MNVKQTLEQQLQTLEPTATLSVSDKADFQCNIAFSLAKQRHTSPVTIANDLAARWQAQYAASATVTAVNGFLNFMVSDDWLIKTAQFVTDQQKLPLPTVKPRTVFFDYGGANIAKELHIGHLRSPIIGEALKRVYQAFGHHTIAGAYLGDWGLQMGLVMAAMQDANLAAEQVTLPMLGELYPAATKRKNTDPDFYARAADITAQLQNYTEPYYTTWQKLRQLSVSQIRKNYERLNCTFDLYDGESSYQKNIPTVLTKLKQAGVLQTSQGALIVNVVQSTDQKPMPPIILQKQNGGYLYATTDVAALYTRHQEYHPDQFIYVADARQSLHFEQVFRTARLGNLVSPTTQLTHVPYGTINGTDGKPFKTRDGGTIKLEDILTTVSAATTEFAVGLSAIKFADLINNVNKDYVFDLQKCTAFEGKTGPYLLYTVVRITSIFNKVGDYKINFANLPQYLNPTIRDILVKILHLTEAYTVTLHSLSLHPIADALYNLANSFAVFYATENISTITDPAKKELYLSIAALTQTALTYGLHTLAIDTVKKM